MAHPFIRAGFPQFTFVQHSMGGGIPPPKGKFGHPVEKNYYNLLAVNCDASMDDIKKAFRKMSIKHHPDKGGDMEQFKNITRAYEVLSDEEQRLCYDAYGNSFHTLPFIEQFKQQSRSKSVQIGLKVSLPEFLQGKTCSVTYTRHDHTRKSQGNESMTHSFSLPPGTLHKHQFVFPNLGHKEVNKLPGSLIVVVQEEVYPHFKRIGNVLIHEKSISLVEALTGSPLEVKHPKGHTITLYSDGSFMHDKLYKVPKEGGTSDTNLYIHIKIVFPTLTAEQKVALAGIMKCTIPEKPAHAVLAVVTHESSIMQEVEESKHDRDDQGTQQVPPDCHTQ